MTLIPKSRTLAALRDAPRIHLGLSGEIRVPDTKNCDKRVAHA